MYVIVIGLNRLLLESEKEDPGTDQDGPDIWYFRAYYVLYEKTWVSFDSSWKKKYNERKRGASVLSEGMCLENLQVEKLHSSATFISQIGGLAVK